MPGRPRLTLVGAIVLLAALSLLSVLQQRQDGGWRTGGNGGGSDRSSGDGRNVAGQFDYYALALSWSPTHCSTSEGENDTLQCSRRDGRRYAFVLHGLWPQYERGYPESCRIEQRPFVPQPVIDNVLDIMPSKGLVIHQYRKHGTCSGLSPDAYFKLARRLFEAIKIPARFANPLEPQYLSPDDLVDDLVAANPGLKPDMIVVECGGPGSRLEEVRICFTREGAFRRCGSNEEERKLCRSDRIQVPPVGSTKRPG
jgi:ribonuclease T2